jgi:pimeloyl-ACP methyl ester carboxylesterase
MRLLAGLALGLALGGPALPVAAKGVLEPCRIAGIAHEVACGSVRRALDPARPGGVQIDVQFVVVPAMARRRLPDPVFLLAGGPGQSAIEAAPLLMPSFARLNNRRDIVFVDQRGTGRSAPLECTEARREPLSDASDPDHQVALLARCRARLVTLPYVGGPDGLRHYTTTVAMQDLDAVRRALGYERINVVGGSYGTRAGLEYLRQFPQAVRRLVLDGVAPPDMALPASFSTDSQAAFDAMLMACEREPACQAAHPDLRARWTALLAGLPRQVTVPDPLTGELVEMRLTRDVVLGAVRGPLYLPALAAALPPAIDAASRGRYEALAGIASMLHARRGTDLALGMHFSVVCAEDLPRLGTSTDPPGADFGRDFARLYERVCADWPRGDVPAAFYTVPRSSVPALLLSGGDDPATPPRHGARVAAALGPAARHVVVPHAGHGVMSIGCMRDVLFRFIDAVDDAAAGAVDAGCATRIPRPPAFQPIAAATAPAASSVVSPARSAASQSASVPAATGASAPAPR